MKCVFLLTLGFAAAVNPISKVLSLLEDLQKKVLQDGEVEQKQFEKFGEWCKDEAVAKQYEIKDAKAKAEGLRAVIEKAGAEIVTADANIDELAKKVGRNQKDLAAATEIRNKENADFVAADNDLAETIDMLGRAAGILARSLKGGSFAQVSKAGISALENALSTVMKVSAFTTQDKSKLQALVQESQGDDFLTRSAPEAAAYENQSGGILDVLEDMKDKAIAMKNDGQKAEMNSKHSFELLKQSLENEIAVDSKELDENKQNKAAASEEKATAEGDLERTEKTLAEAETALAGLSQDCQQKAADWEVSQKSRAEELEALTQARKIIAEKTGGATSRAYDFMQIENTGRSKASLVSASVVDKLKKLGRLNGDVAMSQLSLRVQAAMDMSSGADVFAKVRGMIQDMIEKLVAEAAEEASHKAWCDKEMGDARAKIEDHTSKIDKLSTRIDKANAAIAQLTDSTATLESELAELAKQQAAMDQMRREEKAAFQKAKKDYEDGVEGLTMALQVLRDYYAADPAFLQQPATSVHAKSGDAAGGIIAMLEVAQSDFSKLLADAEVEESSAQDAYEKITQENEIAKAMKTSDVKFQKKEKATLEKNMAENKEDREGEQAELDAVTEYLAKVAPGCTTKPMSYEERKQRRENEIAGLKEALRILEEESAPASFLAIRSKHA